MNFPAISVNDLTSQMFLSLVLGATSVTPTMLRLTSSFDEGDGRFVLVSSCLIQFIILYINLLSSPSLFNYLILNAVWLIKVTHPIFLISYILTWLRESCWLNKFKDSCSWLFISWDDNNWDGNTQTDNFQKKVRYTWIIELMNRFPWDVRMPPISLGFRHVPVLPWHIIRGLE